MTTAQLLAFNAALLAAIVSPGPAMLVALRTTLGEGRQAGLAIGFGLTLVAAGWTAAAVLGLEALFALFPWAYAAMKIAGAVYLLYIAYTMWRGARQPVEVGVTPAGNALVRGILVNLLNPKSVLFATAVLLVVFPGGLSPVDGTLVVLNHLVIELAFYGLLAVGVSQTAVSRRYPAAKVYLDRTASVVLGALGPRLLTKA